MKRVGPAQHLSGLLGRAVRRAYPNVPHESFPATMHRSMLPLSQAHYQLNVAFPLSKHLRTKPRDIAQRIVAETPPDEAVSSISVAGAGFVNVRLSAQWLGSQLGAAAQVPLTESRKRVIIDYASPNMAKELHVGHLRTVVIGDALARLLEARGHEVTRVSHVGDFGTPLAQTLELLRERQQRPLTLSPAQLSETYLAAKVRAKTDAAFVTRAHQFLAAMQRPEASDARDLWQEICTASRNGYSAIFRTLGVSKALTERGEASYASLLPALVADLMSKGVAVLSEGAVVVPAPEQAEGVPSIAPLVVRKSDGTYGYATTDLAALRMRVQEQHDWLVYVVDRSQGAHLRAVFAAARAAGYVPSSVVATHLPFGVVRGESGSKLASRDGAPTSLAHLLHEAVAEATRALSATRSLLAAETHGSDSGGKATSGHSRRTGMEDGGAALEADADALGIAAVKYFELAQHPLSDYVFSLPRVMALRGNTALYLNYATARITALNRRVAGQATGVLGGNASAAVEGEEEEALALKLAQFGEAVQAAELELAPSHICTYLFELAQRFHAFYDACRIVGHARQSQRLALAHATHAVLSQGFAILGLRTAQRI